MGKVFKGIDVNGAEDINWSSASKEISFAFIRAGTSRRRNPSLQRQVDGAHAAGLPVGVYWVGRSTTIEDAQEEAELCINIIRDLRIDLCVYYMWDEQSKAKARRKGVDLTRAEMQWVGNAFREIVSDAGYDTGAAYGRQMYEIYRRNGTLRGRAVQPFINQHQWCTGPGERPPSADFAMWTQTTTARISGVPGDTKLLILYAGHMLGRFLHPEPCDTKPTYLHKRRYIAGAPLKLRKNPAVHSELVRYADLPSYMRIVCMRGADGSAILRKGERFPADRVRSHPAGVFIRIPCGAWVLAWSARRKRKNMM